MEEEFDRQVRTLLDKGYPELANLSESEFNKLIEPLRTHISFLPKTKADLEQGTIPFVLAVNNSLISAEEMMGKTELNDKPGITKLFPHTSADFSIIKVEPPSSPIYLLVDIDRGKETLNITPEEAYKIIEGEKRSPLTIAEGIALITHFPEFLQKNNCFSLLASRNPQDQRVPAIWINASKQPNLGWCWDRNPHTWLGSASASKRVA